MHQTNWTFTSTKIVLSSRLCKEGRRPSNWLMDAFVRHFSAPRIHNDDRQTLAPNIYCHHESKTTVAIRTSGSRPMAGLSYIFSLHIDCVCIANTAFPVVTDAILVPRYRCVKLVCSNCKRKHIIDTWANIYVYSYRKYSTGLQRLGKNIMAPATPRNVP